MEREGKTSTLRWPDGSPRWCPNCRMGEGQCPQNDTSWRPGCRMFDPKAKLSADGHEVAPVTALCEACGSEGRILRDATTRFDFEPREIDLGPCQVCEGTGREVIENVAPVTLEDLP